MMAKQYQNMMAEPQTISTTEQFKLKQFFTIKQTWHYLFSSVILLSFI